MGKRLRSIAVSLGSNEMTITKHAIQRFQQRVAPVPSKHVPIVIREMLRESKFIYSVTNGSNAYLAHEKCVFVVSADGAIITILPPMQTSHQLFENKKFARRDQQMKEKLFTSRRVGRRKKPGPGEIHER